jgi:long-chain acyl-CoA synthetase
MSRAGARYGYGPDTVTLLSTPLYSNTTLVVFFPTLAFGGAVLLMPKFDAAAYLRLAEAQHVTHTMLVPVQYQRLMARPDFDAHDLSRFRMKFSTSAPFNAALKADVLKRWPGGLAGVLWPDRRRRHLHPRSPQLPPTSCTPWAARPKAMTCA